MTKLKITSDRDLDLLLEHPSQHVYTAFQHLVDRPAIYIYGAGNVGRKVGRALREKGYSVIGFLDKNHLLNGLHIDGIPVLSESQLKPDITDVCVIGIWSYHHDPRTTFEKLAALGFSNVMHFLAATVFFDLEGVLPNYAVGHPLELKELASSGRFERVLRSFADRESQDVFTRTLSFNFAPFASNLTAVRRGSLPFDPRTVLLYVDGGAFIGADFRARAQAFERLECAILVEPDSRTFATLVSEHFPEVPDCVRVNAALSSSKGELLFSNAGDWGSRVVESAQASSGVVVDCVPLDELVQGRPSPVYVKMDLEGHELSALQGSVASLSRPDVIFSVTLEHRLMDLFEIPEYLSCFPDRSLFLYNHDTEYRMDQVVYSVPKALCRSDFRLS